VSRIVARGWATVELERAAAELTDHLTPGTTFEEASRSAILGARCMRGRARPAALAGKGEDADVDWIVLLEPDTEGRLAGYLARFGEGWAVTWTATDDPPGRLGPGVGPGPFGEECLADGSAAGGPFRVLLSAATIDP
jgi:hypothetical protein